MRHRVFHTRSLAPLVLGVCVWLVWPAQALAQALIRFIHAVPGVGTATVTADGENLGSIGFAQSTQWRSIRSGSFRWTLTGAGKTLASGATTVGDGAYDIVILRKPAGVSLGVYKAAAGRTGTSLVRVIHAAPELGSPALEVDGKQVAKSLGYTQATPYLSVTPGSHSLSAMRPGDSTPLVSATHITLSSGASYSAVVVGTRGQMVRVVTLTDRGAPLTRPVSATRVPASSGAAAPAGAAGASTSGSASASSSGSSTAGGSMVVRPGDCLWQIAAQLAGPHAGSAAIEQKVVEIWNMNAQRIGTGDPNLIFPGTRLRLP